MTCPDCNYYNADGPENPCETCHGTGEVADRPIPATLRHDAEAAGGAGVRYICGKCGVPTRPAKDPDTLDSGTVLVCVECDEETVVDLDTPEARAARYAAQAEATRLRKALESVSCLLAEGPDAYALTDNPRGWKRAAEEVISKALLDLAKGGGNA